MLTNARASSMEAVTKLGSEDSYMEVTWKFNLDVLSGEFTEENLDALGNPTATVKKTRRPRRTTLHGFTTGLDLD